MYNKRNIDTTKVEIKIEKLNPQVQLVVFKKVTMVLRGEEITVARIIMTSEGKVTSVNDTPIALASKKLMQVGEGGL